MGAKNSVSALVSDDFMQGNRILISADFHGETVRIEVIVTVVGSIAYAVDLRTGSSWTRPQLMEYFARRTDSARCEVIPFVS